MAASKKPATRTRVDSMTESATTDPQPHDADGAEGKQVLMACLVISPLRHDGTRYKVGDPVLLAPNTFETLRRQGVVVVA
jgi:hypothetical protein